MGLKFEVDTLDDVPEALRDHYSGSDDDGYELQIEGYDPKAAASSLKAERDRRKRAEKKLKAFGDTTPDEIADLRQMIEELESGKGGESEALERERAKHTKELGKVTADRDAWKGRAEKVTKHDAAMKAIVDAGGIPDALLPHVTKRLDLNADGEDMEVSAIGLDGVETDLGDLIAQMKATDRFDWGFKADGAAGGGSSGRGAGGAGGNGRITKRSQLDTDAKAAAYIKEHGMEAFNGLDRTDWTP